MHGQVFIDDKVSRFGLTLPNCPVLNILKRWDVLMISRHWVNNDLHRWIETSLGYLERSDDMDRDMAGPG